ncbi:hypothetical protein EDB81DRAFT_796262 [Dactylonectria macrodidyma]|uniref:NACHT domain-containing protein n=1 Tax=Dactylonectria macrodidyma TaxID=307937 RepID=A0A9P9ESB2_9HYPO|nr:hypothetical protein EDB81DRAFT_796262 [Dactylonectria macrodidyma]
MASSHRLSHDDYTVGWICALPVEMAASQALLDEHHLPLKQSSRDRNSYTVGRIGAHNVVMACLPDGGTGTVSAAIVANEMITSFRCLRFGLMVGVGGGVPSDKRDIRLGDVVVSHPGSVYGGVIQYDFGKTMQGAHFTPTNSLDKPPRILRTAVAQLRSKHFRESPELPRYLLQITKNYPQMKAEYAHPGVQNDVLYESEYDHPLCQETCSRCDANRIKKREARVSLDPVIHYGLIASGDQVMRHGATRDRLMKQLNMACFEMEAAGLMDDFPCLVIRGICDYADSHKNKVWQPYAAAAAAAYSKELLNFIPESRVRDTPSVIETPTPDLKQPNPSAHGEASAIETPVPSALALAETFRSYLDSFPVLFLPQDPPRQLRIARERFELEKTLLLQWASRIRLLRGPFPSKLEDPDVRKAIERSLGDLHSILHEGQDSDFEELYGLVRLQDFPLPIEKEQPVNRQTNSKAPDPSLSTNFQRLKTLKIPLRRNRGDRTDGTRKTFSRPRKISNWVIDGIVTFEVLLQDLAEVVDKLDDIIPASQGTKLLMTEEDVNPNWPAEFLALVHDAAIERSSAFIQITRAHLEKKCHKKILRRLKSPEMTMRKDAISPQFEQTLSWALSTQRLRQKWDSLPNWLQSSSGIYWLSGKAGSGKSTLMKLLCDHAITLDYLSAWANGGACATAHFFIWKLGVREQTTLYGLFRSVLYQILALDPSLCQDLIPKMWKEAYGHDGMEFNIPTPAEIFGLSDAIRDHPRLAKTCLFIDGLDEFSGDTAEGIAFIKQLASGPNIKIVVSSRPEPALVSAFKRFPNMRLENLTRPDIALYIEGVLRVPLRDYAVETSDEEGTEALVSEMVDKASGVFLWVVLACRSLLDGLIAYDSPSELRKRIDELPPKLEDLFRDMLMRVDQRYQVQAARILKICEIYTAGNGLGIPTIGLAQLDGHDFDTGKMPDVLKNSPTQREMELNCERLEGRLRSRCGGLLEVHRSHRLPERFCFCGQISFGGLHTCHEGYNVDSVVVFMHRSVFDFLDRDETWEIDCLRLDDDEAFDPHAAVACLSLHLALFCVHQNSEKTLRQSTEHIRNIWTQATLASWRPPGQILPVAMALKYVLHAFGHSEEVGSWASLPPAQILLRLGAESGMIEVIEELRQKSSVELVAEGGYPLVYHATVPLISRFILSDPYDEHSVISPPFPPVISPHYTVQWLLSLGCSPNEQFLLLNVSTTPWEQWTQMLGEPRVFRLEQLQVFANITAVYLEATNFELASLEVVKSWVDRCLLYCSTCAQSSMRMAFEAQLRDIQGLVGRRTAPTNKTRPADETRPVDKTASANNTTPAHKTTPTNKNTAVNKIRTFLLSLGSRA